MTIEPPAVPGAPLWRRALAEYLGTAGLVMVVVGSGISAQRLSNDPGLQLLENSLATALGLGVLVLLTAPVSDAHLNPVVSFAAFALRRGDATGMTGRRLCSYVAAQLAGGVSGVLLAHAMFAVTPGVSGTDRATPATFLAEIVATAGLVLVVVGLSRSGRSAPVVAAAVGAYIGAAYWFTSSTAFANPAVTIGRVFTDTFAGIAPGSALAFIAAQAIGGGVGVGLGVALFARRPMRVRAAAGP